MISWGPTSVWAGSESPSRINRSKAETSWAFRKDVSATSASATSPTYWDRWHQKSQANPTTWDFNINHLKKWDKRGRFQPQLVSLPDFWLPSTVSTPLVNEHIASRMEYIPIDFHRISSHRRAINSGPSFHFTATNWPLVGDYTKNGSE